MRTGRKPEKVICRKKAERKDDKKKGKEMWEKKDAVRKS
jgi:hypothetical protein